MFWERVASGQHAFSGRPLSGGPHWATEDAEPRGDGDEFESPWESPWESAQLAVITLLMVMVFGVVWVTFELEAAIGIAEATSYDVAARDPSSPSAFNPPGFSMSPRSSSSTRTPPTPATPPKSAGAGF